MDSLKRRNLVLFVAGRLVSLVGSGIQMIALPLFIYDRTHSATLMGTFTFLGMVPALLAAPFAGVLGDRLNRKAIAVYTDCGRGVLIFGLAWLAHLDRLGISTLFACQVLISLLDSFFNAATAAMLPDLTDAADYGRANAARSGVDCLSMIVGPILGGIIYGLLGVRMVFMLNAVSFLVSALCEQFIVYRAGAANETKLTLRNSLAEIREVISFIMRRRGLGHLFSFAMFSNFLVTPVILVGFPFVFRKIMGFSSEQYGYLMTTFMAGVLLGNLLLGTLFGRTDTGRLLRVGLLVQGVLFVGLMGLIFPAFTSLFGGRLWTLFTVLAAGFVLAGVFNAFVNTPLQTNLQKMVPAGMRARFFAVLGLIAQGAVPIGAIVYGFLLDRLPPHLILLGAAVLSLMATLVFLGFAAPEAFEPMAEPAL